MARFDADRDGKLNPQEFGAMTRASLEASLRLTEDQEMAGMA